MKLESWNAESKLESAFGLKVVSEGSERWRGATGRAIRSFILRPGPRLRPALILLRWLECFVGRVVLQNGRIGRPAAVARS